MKRLLVCLPFVLLSVMLVGSQLQAQDVAKPALRTWKDSTGQFSVEAVFVRVNGEQVVLQRKDKAEISIPLAKLSAADQQYVKARLTPPISPEQAIAALERIEAQLKKANGVVVSVAKIQFDSDDKGIKLTDAALANIRAFPHLRKFVHLGSFSSASGAGLVHFQGLMKLEMLRFQAVRFTDNDLAHLSGLTNLRALSLKVDLNPSSKITRAGIEHLKGLMKLEDLTLLRLGLTDDSLEPLKNLTNLKELTLADEQITDAGVAELQKALPNCKIKH